MRDYRTHRPGTYQEMTSGFRWEVPASYNLAADVLDKHEPDRPAMHFVSDEGRGLDHRPDDMRGSHFGLQGIRERVDKLGGIFQIDAAPGAGTRLSVTVPIHRNAGDAAFPQVAQSWRTN